MGPKYVDASCELAASTFQTSVASAYEVSLPDCTFDFSAFTGVSTCTAYYNAYGTFCQQLGSCSTPIIGDDSGSMHPCYSESPTYTDADGYGCSSWFGYDCTSVVADYGWTEVQAQSLLANCPICCAAYVPDSGSGSGSGRPRGSLAAQRRAVRATRHPGREAATALMGQRRVRSAPAWTSELLRSNDHSSSPALKATSSASRSSRPIPRRASLTA